MEALSRQNPVLMIFEESIGSIPQALEAFGRAVDRIKNGWRVADRHISTRI